MWQTQCHWHHPQVFTNFMVGISYTPSPNGSSLLGIPHDLAKSRNIAGTRYSEVNCKPWSLHLHPFYIYSNVVCALTLPSSVPQSLAAVAEWRVTNAPHGRKRSHRLLLPQATNHSNNDNHLNCNHKNVGWWLHTPMYTHFLLKVDLSLGCMHYTSYSETNLTICQTPCKEHSHALRTALQLAALQPPFHPPAFSPEKTVVRIWNVMRLMR